MHPILLKLGPFTIYSYGVMVALGFGLSTLLIYRRAGKFGLDKDKIIDLAILILISGIVGARLLYVILNLKYYIANPLEVLELSKGGLVWYGAFLFALVLSIFYIRRNKLQFWAVMDLVAPYIALAQAFGRVGCFLNGCCYGLEVTSSYPLAVIFPNEGILRLPVQIYSALVLFFIFILLSLWQDRRRFTGEVFLGYCILYSIKRFLMEFLRSDNPRIFFGFTLSQVISVILLLIVSAIFLYKAFEWKKKNFPLK